MAMNPPQTVCLTMIVKNESRVIRRCLESVRPHIHSWLIIDTGSTDGTQALIRELLADVPGELLERPWRNFAVNRTEALHSARDKADYLLLIDADEELLTREPLPKLTAPLYLFTFRIADSQTTWSRPALLRSDLPWRYEGVLHEYLECDPPQSSEVLAGFFVRSHSDGDRNVDPVKKYREDARLLEEALLTEPNNTRYVFYLAQSYRDAEELEQAIPVYERRAALGGWAEEVYCSLLEIATLSERLNRPWPLVLTAYLRAYNFRPERAEPLCAIAAHYRSTQEWGLAELFARAAVALPRPSDILFVDDSVYAWRARDELAIALFYRGKFEEARALNQALLANAAVPASERGRLQQNLGFCQRALGRAP